MGDLPNSIPGAHSAAVYRYAVELVEDTRRANDSRLGEARDLAAVVRIADEQAADRILSAAEEACARDLQTAEQQAEEVVRHARAGIMAAVQRYTDNLIAEARRAGEGRLVKATELAELVRLADSSAADRLLAAIQTVNEAALRSAERQAQGVLETAQSRLTAGARGTGGLGTAQMPAPGFGQSPAEPGSVAGHQDGGSAASAPLAAPTHPIGNGFSVADEKRSGEADSAQRTQES